MLCTLISCSSGRKKPEDMPALFPVKVTIQQDGQILSDASVILLRQEPPFKWVAGGLTDTNGICSVRTQSFFAGAPAGKYKVMVSKQLDETPEADKNLPPDPSGTNKSLDYYFELVDLKYNSDQTSDLEVVVEEKKNEFVLDVGKAVKLKIARTGM